MSKQRILPLEPSGAARSSGNRKWAIYAGLAVIAVLIFAYIGGGEEPIRPIEQQIALPTGGGANANSGEQ